MYKIIDLDNCISNDGHRLNKIDFAKSDLHDRYHAYNVYAFLDDDANMDLLQGPERIIISTSRPEQYRSLTESWLMKRDAKIYMLMMRPDGNHASSADIKKEHYRLLINQQYINPDDIVYAADDNPNVIAMYQSIGVKTRHVYIMEPNKYREQTHG